MGVGKPRLDAYEKLLHRFYEPLLLLKKLLGKKTLGPHLIANHEPSNPEGTRRRFLKNLAYICDFEKGGSSTASIGVEEREDCFVIWLASNEDDEGAGAAFLGDTLEFLRKVLELQGVERKEGIIKLLKHCVKQASSRVNKEAKNLLRAAKKSKEFLEQEAERQDLINWLRKFEFNKRTTPLSVCLFAYDRRHDEMMRQLEQILSELSHNGSGESELFIQLGRARHYVGRLAQHVRSVYELIKDGSRLTEFLDACKASVEKVPSPKCVSAPEPDNHTNFPGIINRMIRSNEKGKWRQIETSKETLSSQYTDEVIVSLYERPSLKPRVHSEVQILEHFYSNGLRFAYNDKFVATSKPSCFCCSLYFRHHPGHFVEPETHGKVYDNWGPVYLPGGREHPDFKSQRELMTKVIEGVREETLDILLGLTNSWSFHHDSISGITPRDDMSTLELESDSGSDTDELSDSGLEMQMEAGSEVEDLIASHESEDEDDNTPGGAPL